MLTSFLKSVLPHRVLYPQRRRYRDGSAAATTTSSRAEPIRLLGFLVGGLLLASAVLLLSAALRAPSPDSRVDVPARGPAAAIAAGQASAIGVTATDGRAVPDLHEASAADRLPEPIIATIDPTCAAHAREKLMVGLTNYYLQRRLRPGATTDDAAETSILTGVLAGPGDPAATTPETSCKG
ncbi:MAG: hypothetical protein ACO1NY_12955 [Pseudorhodoplanes sp.]